MIRRKVSHIWRSISGFKFSERNRKMNELRTKARGRERERDRERAHRIWYIIQNTFVNSEFITIEWQQLINRSIVIISSYWFYTCTNWYMGKCHRVDTISISIISDETFFLTCHVLPSSLLFVFVFFFSFISFRSLPSISFFDLFSKHLFLFVFPSFRKPNQFYSKTINMEWIAMLRYHVTAHKIHKLLR